MDKVVPLDLFPYLLWAKNGFTVKVEIKDAVIDIDGIIWGCILVVCFGSPYLRWNFNYKYGAAGLFC